MESSAIRLVCNKQGTCSIVIGSSDNVIERLHGSCHLSTQHSLLFADCCFKLQKSHQIPDYCLPMHFVMMSKAVSPIHENGRNYFSSACALQFDLTSMPSPLHPFLEVKPKRWNKLTHHLIHHWKITILLSVDSLAALKIRPFANCSVMLV